LKLEQIYFDDSIRDYALKLTGNKLEAEELISTAFEICLTKPPIENLKGYFAMVMRNQYLKKCKKQDPYFDNENSEHPEVEQVLDRMNHYYANILRAISNGETLTQIHKGASIGYRTLRDDYIKAKKQFKIMYENKIKIAVIIRGINGVSYHRLLMPFAKMQRDYGIEVVVLLNKDDEFFNNLEGVTHVVYNRNISGLLQPEETFLKLKAKGIKVICDIDDYWVLPKGHPMRYYYQKTNLDKCIVKNLKLADQIWTTTSILADKVKPYNKNIVVIKNALDPTEKQYAYDDLSLNFDTFFYSGGTTHLKDLKLLGNAFDDSKLLIKAPRLPKRMKAIKKQISDIQSYADDYKHCGICVIPLQDNVFNSCKSELKMIEAGHFAKPVMVSAVEPYTLLSTNKNSLKVYNNEWSNAIKKIKGNHTMQVDLGLKLKEDITIKHDITKENEKRLQSL
jgi:glycosyltransferase involved in cell wall biosynthesis